MTLDDRHIMAKHAAIYPHEDELKAVNKLVTVAEQALKALSDQFVNEDHPLPKAGLSACRFDWNEQSWKSSS